MAHGAGSTGRGASPCKARGEKMFRGCRERREPAVDQPEPKLGPLCKRRDRSITCTCPHCPSPPNRRTWLVCVSSQPLLCHREAMASGTVYPTRSACQAPNPGAFQQGLEMRGKCSLGAGRKGHRRKVPSPSWLLQWSQWKQAGLGRAAPSRALLSRAMSSFPRSQNCPVWLEKHPSRARA